MADLEDLLAQRLAIAFETVVGRPCDPAVRRSQHADFQADGALGVARALATSPRAIAEQVVAVAHLHDVCERVEISGPGFINLTVANQVLGQLLAEVSIDDRLGVSPTSQPEIVTVDYSAPNAAKEMHVGHLRSTIIGDAAVRLLEWQGHEVIRQNHVGDWGTPFGMLIEHLLDLGESEAAHELSVGDLNGFYRAARRKFDADADFRERSRLRVVALQSDDPSTGRLWDVLIAMSKQYFAGVYARLGVRLTDADYVGESFYNDQLQSVLAELDGRGMLVESDGAQCVFPAGFHGRDGAALPVIVRKTDGGFGYGATDLATIRHRTTVLRATRLLYVVGLPQRQHFAMIFETAREAGWLAAPARAEHVGHGSVLGSDGRMLRTRAGIEVLLVDLLDEAVARAEVIVDAKNPELDPELRAEIARAVGIGAVKYADLSTDRIKDYVFDLDRMVSLEGNTAPYLQYARARICSIFSRGGVTASRELKAVLIQEPQERALALALLGFGAVIDETADTLEFHTLAQYLFGLASTFTTFYETCPVLKAGDEVRESRLVLCDITARTLQRGLNLLGIDSPEQM
jgi:arginyl-tRNA synthetase